MNVAYKASADNYVERMIEKLNFHHHHHHQ